MRKIAALLVILAAMSAKQADAVELLVKVGNTLYATEGAIGALANTTAQVNSISIPSLNQQARSQIVGQLQAALNYEAGARSAAYACRYYAEIMVKMHPRDPRYAAVMKGFNDARDACYLHTRTARALTESANNTATRYGLSGMLLPALQRVRQAAEAAEALSRWIPNDGGYTGMDPMPL